MKADKQDWRTLIGASAANTTPARAGSADVLEIRRVQCVLTEPLFKRLLRKIFPDQRKQERIPVPPLVGYLGLVRSTKPYEVGDISLSGFCLVTDERWTPGTEMPITLERTNFGAGDSEYFTVQANVVRCGKDGVAFSILLSEEESNAACANPLRVRWASQPEMELFLKRLKVQPPLPMPVGGDGGSNAGIARVQSAGTPFEVLHPALRKTGSN